ncbi:MAG: sigma-54 dependent transcriptional regulator [Desulfosoma sp.]
MEKGRILIIEDEMRLGEGCRMVLSERGYEVRVCSTARCGQETLAAESFDVVLLDLRLPDGEGMEILQQAKKHNRRECFIVMTGYATVENAVKAMKLGAFDYLCKPFLEDQLVLSVERAIEKRKLVEENARLRKEIADRFSFANIIGEDPAMLKVFDQVARVAPTDTTVLICGEHGTGKELFARAIHAHSPRATRPFIAVDCSTLSSTLLESELFGHVKGAFTGAIQDKKGIFEAAHGGTLFLDDIANLSLETQGKLLRVLEVREYKPVGATVFKTTDTRVICATNRDLKAMTQEGTFREDLFYRLNVFPIVLPPLRERKDDIPRLAYHFLRLFCRKTGKKIDGFTEDALEALKEHPWPGNVRQLKNVVERLVIMADQPIVHVWDLMDHIHGAGRWGVESLPQTMDDLKKMKKRLLEETYARIEKAFLKKVLEESGGNISKAAQKIGMKRSNLSVLLKKHKIRLQAHTNRSSELSTVSFDIR